MKLTSDTVKKVAQLANLPIASDEEEKYSRQLSKILDYFEQLNKINTENVEPLFNVTNLSNTFRNDKTSVGLTQDEALGNASNKKNGFFATKGIFENE